MRYLEILDSILQKLMDLTFWLSGTYDENGERGICIWLNLIVV